MLERFDETDCKCGLPVPVEASPEGELVRYADAHATIADLQGQLLEWKRALHSLTPGGSEYANDSKACVEWVREARSRQHEAIIDGVKQRKDLQQRVAQLEGENEKLKTRRKEWGEAEYIKLREFFDAALRRAKAEGMEAAAKFVDDDCYIPGGQLLPDYEHRCKHNVNQKELAAKIRARAAQIEEGE
jgi:hypothetical protein